MAKGHISQGLNLASIPVLQLFGLLGEPILKPELELGESWDLHSSISLHSFHCDVLMYHPPHPTPCTGSYKGPTRTWWEAQAGGGEQSQSQQDPGSCQDL